MTIEISHDKENNILVFDLIEASEYKKVYHHSIDEGFTCLLDVDENGTLLGVEILLPKEVSYGE